MKILQMEKLISREIGRISWNQFEELERAGIFLKIEWMKKKWKKRNYKDKLKKTKKIKNKMKLKKKIRYEKLWKKRTWNKTTIEVKGKQLRKSVKRGKNCRGLG